MREHRSSSGRDRVPAQAQIIGPVQELVGFTRHFWAVPMVVGIGCLLLVSLAVSALLWVYFAAQIVVFGAGFTKRSRSAP